MPSIKWWFGSSLHAFIIAFAGAASVALAESAGVLPRLHVVAHYSPRWTRLAAAYRTRVCFLAHGTRAGHGTHRLIFVQEEP